MRNAGWTGGVRETWRESFIPGAEQRSGRWRTRTRVDLKDQISVVRNQVEGLREQGGIQLTAVARDVLGVSGWAMLEKIAAGVTDGEVLASPARGLLRKKKEPLKEALAGRLEPVYRMLLKQYLNQG